jgi:hypothetical protein
MSDSHRRVDPDLDDALGSRGSQRPDHLDPAQAQRLGDLFLGQPLDIIEPGRADLCVGHRFAALPQPDVLCRHHRILAGWSIAHLANHRRSASAVQSLREL